jgi:hypothetical protein
MIFFIIDGNAKTIKQQDAMLDIEMIKALIGYPSIDSDEVNTKNDLLYFDESCFIRQTATTGRFQYKNLAPISGIGIIAGKTESSFTSPSMTYDDLRANIRFL